MAVYSPHAYSTDVLRSLSFGNRPPNRETRKLLFRLNLWRPERCRRSDAERRRAACTALPERSPPSVTPLPHPGCARVGAWNIHTLTSKYLAVSDVITTQNLDLLALTETWHSSSSDVALRRSIPPGYSCIDRPRQDPTNPDRMGGGIAIYHRAPLRVGKIELQSAPETFEALAVSVPFPDGPVTLITVYRPGSSRPTPAFFNELATLLEQFALYNTQVVLVGDLNLHLEDPALLETSEFVTILRQFGLAQHVAEPTHRAGGWLDVIVTRDDTSPVDLEVFPPTISDHGLTTVTLPFLRVGPVRGIRHARAWRDMDRDAFSAALRTSLAPDEAMASMTVTELFAFYERATDDLISTFLPTRAFTERRSLLSPWFDTECRALRRQARRLERLYRRTKSATDRENWVRFVRRMHARYRERECEYWEAKIARHAKDPKRLWATFNGLLGRHGAGSHSKTPEFSAKDFAAYCESKIGSVRADTAGSPLRSFRRQFIAWPR